MNPGFTLNRFDYFKSSTTFFEDVNPPFLVQRENQYFMDIVIPVGNKANLSVGGSFLNNRDNYYQTTSFAPSDSTDETRLDGYKIGLTLERSTLNRKMYANQGTYFAVKLRRYEGNENTITGSTAPVREDIDRDHNWFNMKVIYDNYFDELGPFKLGFYTEVSFSDQPFFSNYTASVLAAPAFQPIPESQTRFLNNFRAHNYGGAGLKAILTFKKRFDLRIEGYVFQPIEEIRRSTFNSRAVYGPVFDRRFFSGTANLVYNSPVGPDQYKWKLLQ